jgi:hypothetical protein
LDYYDIDIYISTWNIQGFGSCISDKYSDNLLNLDDIKKTFNNIINIDLYNYNEITENIKID